LSSANHDEEALSVKEAQLSMMRRLGDVEGILIAQTNLSNTYSRVGRLEQALQMDQDIYCGRVKLVGEEDESTLRAANNYAWRLCKVLHFEEAKALLRKTIPVVRRVLGESRDLTLSMRWVYARALNKDPGATLDDLREAVTTLEDAERIARRVFGGAHPLTTGIERELRDAQAALAASG
jgi:hypothetical protein